MKKHLTLFLILCTLSLQAQVKPQWIRYQTISPDGNTIAFTYKGDFSITNLSLSSLNSTDDSTYTIIGSPDADGAFSIQLPAASVVDSAGNDNSASNTILANYDGTAPTPIITTTSSNPTNDNPIPITIAFGEEMDGIKENDIIVSGGTTGDFSSADSTTFSINDPSISEGASGSTTLQFTVSLSAAAPAGGATVDFATSNGTAIAGTDYTASTGTLSFSAGETSKTIDVTVAGDATVEVDETLTITLSNATGTAVVISDATGTGTITNDDAATVTITDVTPNENDGSVDVTFTLDNAVDGGLDVDVSTADNYIQPE